MNALDADRRAGLNDPVLAPLVRATEGAAEQILEQLLVGTAEPMIRQILTRYAGPGRLLSSDDAQDVAGTVHLRLVTKLRRTRISDDDAVEDFASYVAMATYNAVHDLVRTRYPQRTRLKNRLRYALTHDRRLSFWPSGEGAICGLRGWTTGGAAADVALDESRITPLMRNGNRAADALAAILKALGRPVSFDALARFLADLWNVVDLAPVAELPTPRPVPSPSQQLESREYLVALWNEIRQLRPMQRKALLLNLREGHTVNVLAFVILTGTASFDDVAAALEMSAGELTAIWNDLPLDDLRIAGLLQTTRQQVINLRKAARDRLNRRMNR